MELTCPECGSDAAVTSTDAGGGRLSLTCHFSHGGKGSVTWTASKPGAKQPSVRQSSAPRAPRAAKVAKVTDAAVAANQRAIDAFRAEVARRGGQTTVRRTGSRNEVIVKPAGVAIEFRVLVRSRTSGDFETSAEYGKARREEQFPTVFWAFVDLLPGATNFYIVPEWWIQNDIMEKHTALLESIETAEGAESAESADTAESARPAGPPSSRHAIGTERIAQWAGKWRQLSL